MDTTTVVELEVANVFRFKDGRTVLVGPIDNDVKYIPFSQADVVVDGQVVAVVEVEGEMVPNGRHPAGYRAVSTTDATKLDAVLPDRERISLRIHLNA